VQNANAISKFNAAATIKFSSLSIRFQRHATSHAQLALCGTKYSRAMYLRVKISSLHSRKLRRHITRRQIALQRGRLTKLAAKSRQA